MLSVTVWKFKTLVQLLGAHCGTSCRLAMSTLEYIGAFFEKFAKIDMQASSCSVNSGLNHDPEFKKVCRFEILHTMIHGVLIKVSTKRS